MYTFGSKSYKKMNKPKKTFIVIIISVLILLALVTAWLIYSQKILHNSDDPGVDITVNNIQRRYFIYVPKSVEQSIANKTPLPLVIILHADGGPFGTARLMRGESRWLAKSENQQFIAVFPAARLEKNDQPMHLTDDLSDPKRNIRDWNDGSGRTTASKNNVADVAFIKAVIDDIHTKYTIDNKRVYLVGFLNGASMALKAAQELSDKISAVTAINGELYKESEDFNGQVSLLSIEPNTSSSSAFAHSKEYVNSWKKSLNCAENFSTIANSSQVNAVNYVCQNGTEVTSYTVNIPNDVYPLFHSSKKEDIINATDLAWDFFKRH